MTGESMGILICDSQQLPDPGFLAPLQTLIPKIKDHAEVMMSHVLISQPHGFMEEALASDLRIFAWTSDHVFGQVSFLQWIVVFPFVNWGKIDCRIWKAMFKFKVGHPSDTMRTSQ